jgi:hypothetical protein
VPTKTKQVLDALATNLAAQADCPAVVRNQVLPAELDAFRNVYAFASLNDGDGQITEELLGAGATDALYEVGHTAVLMLTVEGEDIAMRDTVFDDVLIAVDDALIADRTLGVSDEVFARITGLEQEAALANPQTGVEFRMAEISIEISFQSTRAF